MGAIALTQKVSNSHAMPLSVQKGPGAGYLGFQGLQKGRECPVSYALFADLAGRL